MEEIVKAGGPLMWPILLCCVGVIAITVERLWALMPSKIAPKHQLGEVWNLIQSNKLDGAKLKEMRKSSALGRILAAGLNNSRHGREVMKDSIQEAASQVIHDMERFLTILGVIAAITPLLGLLGTVIGMIIVFNDIMIEGTGNAGILAGGISQALITTAAGLSVAIPAMISHRFFLRRVDTLVVTMEQEAVKLVDALHNERRADFKKDGSGKKDLKSKKDVKD